MEFVCPDPKALVRAANVKATLDAFRLVPSFGRRLVERHQLQLEDLRPDNYVPVQRWLDALRDIQSEVGPNVVRRVGYGIIENADFPPQFATVEDILLNLDRIYHVNHKGDVGHYIPENRSDGSIVMRCKTPYPRHFEWGLMEGICTHDKEGRSYNVKFEPAPPDQDLTCTITITRRSRSSEPGRAR